MDPGRCAAWLEASRKLARSTGVRVGTATTTLHAIAARAGARLGARRARALRVATALRAARLNAAAVRKAAQKAAQIDAATALAATRAAAAIDRMAEQLDNAIRTRETQPQPATRPVGVLRETGRAATVGLASATTTIHAGVARARARLGAVASRLSRQRAARLNAAAARTAAQKAAQLDAATALAATRSGRRRPDDRTARRRHPRVAKPT